jgi:hypothetical protein
MTTQTVERAPLTWSPDYWLRHCEGFGVVAPGTGSGSSRSSSTTKTGTLRSSASPVGCSERALAFVRVANIAAIDARAERITLRPGACVRA